MPRKKGVTTSGQQDDATRSDRLQSTTGRFVLTMSDAVHGDESQLAEAVRSVAGVSSIASTSDFTTSGLDVAQAMSADATLFPELGLAVVSADPAGVTSLAATAAADSRIVAVEPERIMYAITDAAGLSADYLRGYRDAAANLYEQATASSVAAAAAQRFSDSAASTWGLEAVRALQTLRDGQGVSVAVLDTGLDLTHPDFAGRVITTQSFVPGAATAQDGHGHGTHCIGTSCGPVNPPGGSRRYGLASAANIFVGKVLSDQGSGSDTSILAGISSALTNQCQVISMSLGADVRTVSVAYDTVGKRALAAGTLIVAAAGNNAQRRFGNVGFVGMPANSPSILAVAALDAGLGIADFSARSNPVSGGQIDIAAPGVAVYSTWPMPQRYNTISGTSMATPHVAGLAALWCQATGATGAALWSALTQAASRLPLDSLDVGSGLAQAPN